MSEARTGVRWHRALLVLLDALLINAAILMAIWLRFDGQIPPLWWEFFRIASLWLTPLMIVFGSLLGLYNRVWAYARSEAALAILFAVTITLLIGSLGLLYAGPPIFSRSILMITWLVACLLIGGSRFGWRQLRRTVWHSDADGENGDRTPVVVYGAGHTGSTFIHHAETSADSPYRILGFVDDDPALNGMIVGGHRVLGTGADLPRIVERFDVEEIILAAPSASGRRIRRMLRHVEDTGARVRTLPRLLETGDGTAALEDVRDLSFEDLLGRDMTDISLELDPDYVAGRTILVTGAGGSIGSEICRQLCRYQPREIILLGRGENRIHSIYQELQSAFPQIRLTTCICNFTNEGHVREVFMRHRPDVVFHAGAHKHVYLMEDHPREAVRNNVFGTGVVALAADAVGVERFVAISTDKAVEPCNVMGASKRLSEILIMGLDRESETNFTAVRFGNVIGSSGSVLTIFKQQALEGRPLTVTHPEATRFFMTVEEAAFLVLQAGALSEGGNIYVLEMGEPICIYEIAREFLKLNGRDPDRPGAIRITSLRRGEKVHERLHSPNEELESTRCRRVQRISINSGHELDLSPSELMARARRAMTSRAEAEALLDAVCDPADPSEIIELAPEAAGE